MGLRERPARENDRMTTVARADSLFRILDYDDDGALSEYEAPLCQTGPIAKDAFVAALNGRIDVKAADARAKAALDWDAERGPGAGERVGHFFAGLGLAIVGIITGIPQLLFCLLALPLAYGNGSNARALFGLVFMFPWAIVADQFDQAVRKHDIGEAAAVEAEKVRQEIRRDCRPTPPLPHARSGVSLTGHS